MIPETDKGKVLEVCPFDIGEPFHFVAHAVSMKGERGGYDFALPPSCAAIAEKIAPGVGFTMVVFETNVEGGRKVRRQSLRRITFDVGEFETCVVVRTRLLNFQEKS